ncbi:MAG: AgmX/PglI C-terminal domain-containing protein [Enhygromyxa sp.]
MTTPNPRSRLPLLLTLTVATLATLAPACATPEPLEPPELRSTVEGALDKQAVRAVVAAEIADVRHCYNAELLEDDSLAGDLAIAFVIAPDGSVSEVEVVDSSMPARFDACIEASVASWSFPAAEGESRVVYPFFMEPG